jgi:DNA-directed RNA polymerase subunit RPC12/RpoP
MIKKGEFTMSNSLVLPAPDMCLLGEPGTILVPLPNVLSVLGVGNRETKCGKCGYILAMGVEKHQLQNIAIKCPDCGELNEL